MSTTQTACFFSERNGGEAWQQGCGRKYSVCARMYTHVYVHTEPEVLIQRDSQWPVLPFQSWQNMEAPWFEAVVHTGSHFLLVLLHLKRVGSLAQWMWIMHIPVAAQWLGWCWE